MPEEYVNRYHPFGWRDMTETPEKNGEYIVAVIHKNSGERFLFNTLWNKGWVCPNGFEITHWHPMPVPPWEIMPNGDES